MFLKSLANQLFLLKSDMLLSIKLLSTLLNAALVMLTLISKDSCLKHSSKLFGLKIGLVVFSGGHGTL